MELVRRPRDLVTTLRARPGEELRILVDDVPFSALQALALVLVGALRPGRFVVESPGGERRRGRPGLLGWALPAAARAVPRELLNSARLHRQAKAMAARDPELPRRAERPDSVLYLRTEPSLRWRGQLVGGASTHTTGVINGFAANGLDVEVIAAEQPEWTEDVRFTSVPLRHVFHFVPWFTVAAHGERIVAAAAGRRPSFVYQRHASGTCAGLELAAQLRVPLVLEYNGSELWVQRHWGTGRVPRSSQLAELLEERDLRSASLVVVVSEVLKEQLVETGIDPARVLVAPNGVDVERLAPYRAHAPSHWRAQLGLAEAPTVGFVGSFGLWHGVRVLPAIAAAVAQKVPDARWVLIGDGGLHAEVASEINARGMNDRVAMPGLMPHDQALELLAACDVCVSPHVPNPDGSRFFGSPTKLFEYMGLAKPIVASDLEQLGEVIADGDTGLLRPPGDADAAAEAVVRLLGDPDLRQSLGRAALERASTVYSWQAHTARILGALRQGSAQRAQDDPLASGAL
jgi:glycosyltransferase involved in cell wall biosynthesis